MNRISRAAVALSLVAAASGASAQDTYLEIPRAAPRQALVKSLAERDGYESIEIRLPFHRCVIGFSSRLGVHESNPLLRRVRRLDQALGVISTLRQASDEDLVEAWGEVDSNGGLNPGPVLLEFQRRPLPILRSKIEAALAVRSTADGRWADHQLSLRAVLRRAVGKPDPLELRVSPLPVSVFPRLPLVEVQAFAVDEEGAVSDRATPFPGSVSHAFHPEVRDSHGRLAFVMERRQGLTSQTRSPRSLLRGEATVVIPLAEFFHGLLPGTYTITVHYGDAEPISEPDGFLSSVTITSRPITFTITRLRVVTSRNAQAEYAALASTLPLDSEVEMISGTYGEWAHGLIAPGSSAGKLLSAGWEAVPALVDLVTDTSVPGARRAWGFGVLHGITGLHRPDQYQGTFGEGASIHVQGEGVEWRRGVGIDSYAQDQLAGRWRAMISALEVVVE